MLTMFLSPGYSSTSRIGQNKASIGFYYLFDRGRTRRGSVPGGGTRGAEAEAPKQHTHARVPAAAAASGSAPRGVPKEAAAGGRGCRINNPGRRSPAGCGWRGARAGAQRPLQSCTRRRVSRFLGGSRCLALPLPPPGSVCVCVCECVCLCMCVCVYVCECALASARTRPRARVVGNANCTHTARGAASSPRGGVGEGKPPRSLKYCWATCLFLFYLCFLCPVCFTHM